MSQAEVFKQLHQGPEILVLPNAWDAASAAMMEDAGARAQPRPPRSPGRTVMLTATPCPSRLC